MKSKNLSCLVIGDINIDFNIQASAYPPEGGVAHAKRSDFRLGGSGCSTALVLQKLGIRTSLAANMGADVFADFAMNHIRTAGLDTNLIQHLSDQQTGFFMILVTPATQRTMFGKRGANTVPLPLDSLLEKTDSVDHLHASGYSLIGNDQYEVVSHVVKYAKEKGKTVSFDPGVCSSEQIRDKIFSLLPFVDYFILSQVERDMLAGEVNKNDRSKFLLDKGCGALVLKQAKNGSSFFNNHIRVHVPAVSLERQTIYDSTGAGDSFNAGFLYGILNGSTPEHALQIGNAAGYAIITTRHGVLDLINENDFEKRIFDLSKQAYK